MLQRIASHGCAVSQGVLAACLASALGLSLAACGSPPPKRTFDDFMEDRIARDGTLLRCDADPQAARDDIECANARRAAAAIELSKERERRKALEQESERKIAALKQEMRERERIAREAALEAARAEREAYEARWREGAASGDAPGGLSDGVGAVSDVGPAVSEPAAPLEPD